VGFGDMTLEELAYDTGLPLNLAKLAQKREHDEPFRIVEGDKTHVLEAIKHEGLKCTEGGRYLHLTGNTDKGKAINILKNLYDQMFGRLEIFGVGDGPNDLPMLKVVDKPFFIRRDAGAKSRFNAWMGILQHVGANVII
jgi:predicted mannosyl-3-phosphoglycerate phosphatase (HAD superfamily)